MQIAQTDPVYYDLLVKYNRVLQQRNKLLKEIREAAGTGINSQLPIWNRELSVLAAAIVRKRLDALVKLQQIAGDIYASITGNKENLMVRYELYILTAVRMHGKNFLLKACLSGSSLIYCAAIPG